MCVLFHNSTADDVIRDADVTEEAFCVLRHIFFFFTLSMFPHTLLVFSAADVQSYLPSYFLKLHRKINITIKKKTNTLY